MKNLAFNGNQELKNQLLVELKQHQEMDDFVRGSWLSDKKKDGTFKGCFYGCTMQTESSPREKFSEKYNIDLWYCYLTENIFEKLPEGEFKNFPYESIEVLPINFDFNKLKSAFLKANLLKQLDWIKDENIRNVLIETSKLFDVPFNEISESAARSAESAARSARSAAWSAESAAWSAARSAESAESAAESAARSAARSAESAAWSAESAARSAAWSAESAAWSAAWSAESAAWSAESAAWSAESAARSAAWSAARSNHYVWMRDTLFELIKNN